MFDQDLEAAIAAAEAGAAVLMAHYRKLEPGQINEKTKHDLVSIADKESEAAIRAVLDARRPGYGFLGEETGASGDAGLRWVVDPLDGTLNFIQGFPHWCVSIGLEDAEGGRAACILDPLRGDRFTATRGGGAFWNGKPMRVSSQARLEGAFLAVGFAFQMTPRIAEFMPVFEAALKRAKGLRRAGSAALDLAHTAAGIFDGFFELGLKPWDFAAGALLVQEAGGDLTDWQGDPKAWRVSGDLIAGPAGVRADLSALRG
ncbi:MAG: inositol monophosphatase [Acidobacteria bacterium]|nr:inositol monophosphatase [Acidobacteriota bacterium]